MPDVPGEPSGAPSSRLAELRCPERDVRARIAQGMSNSAIANLVFLTGRPLEKLVNAIFM
jgi:hypothetical protein